MFYINIFVQSEYVRLKIAKAAVYLLSRKNYCMTFLSAGEHYFLPSLKVSPEKHDADCNSFEANAIEAWMFLANDFPSLAQSWSSRVSSFSLFFLRFFPRFSRSRSHHRSILSEHRERFYSRCGVLDAGYRDCGIREGWYINHDRRHYRWWVAPRDRRNWFRERPIASARDRSRAGIARFCVNGGRYFGQVLDILFNLTWTQMYKSKIFRIFRCIYPFRLTRMFIWTDSVRITLTKYQLLTMHTYNVCNVCIVHTKIIKKRYITALIFS